MFTFKGNNLDATGLVEASYTNMYVYLSIVVVFIMCKWCGLTIHIYFRVFEINWVRV